MAQCIQEKIAFSALIKFGVIIVTRLSDLEALSELSQLSCCGSCLLVWYFDNVSMISILLSLVSIRLSILFSWFRVSSCDSVILNVKLR